MKPLAVDVVAQAIRTNPRDTAAGTLSERYLRALHAAGYVVKDRDEEIFAAIDRLPDPNGEVMSVQEAGSGFKAARPSVESDPAVTLDCPGPATLKQPKG